MTGSFQICSFTRGWNETDNNSDEATPVPIPNTAVKLVRVDGIGAQFGAERVDRCRSHPSLLKKDLNPAEMRGFLFYMLMFTPLCEFSGRVLFLRLSSVRLGARPLFLSLVLSSREGLADISSG